jgi:hypothetical protein
MTYGQNRGIGAYDVQDAPLPQQSYFNPMTMGLLMNAFKKGQQPNPQVPMAGDPNQDPNGGQQVGYGLGQQVIGQYPGGQPPQNAQQNPSPMPSPYSSMNDPNQQGQNPLLQALMRQKTSGGY